MGPTLSSLQVPGTTLLVRHWPRDDARASLLLVHGVSEHAGRWHHVAEHFVGNGFDVWAYDHRGHGGSGGRRLDIGRFSTFPDDLQVVLSTLPDDRPRFVYAHSLGGLIATVYATSDRPQPDGWVLSAPSLQASIPKLMIPAGRAIGRVLPTARIPSPVAGAQLSRNPAVGEAFRDDPLVNLAVTARFGIAVVDAMTTVTADLDRIRGPVLVIHGEDDSLVPPKASEPFIGLPGVERVTYPGVRHELHNEPEAPQVLGDVTRWLQRH